MFYTTQNKSAAADHKFSSKKFSSSSCMSFGTFYVVGNPLRGGICIFKRLKLVYYVLSTPKSRE